MFMRVQIGEQKFKSFLSQPFVNNNYVHSYSEYMII